MCLGLLSAALTGVLFLMVLLLVSGWALSPLEAAAVVSALPLGAFIGTRIPGRDAQRAIAGSVLVGAGVLSLAFLPGDDVAMTIAPQLIAGIGMGMALPALAGGLLPERTSADAAHLLAVRHLGITLALVLLAPVAASQLDDAAELTRERGAALVLDARLPPLDKVELAEAATADLEAIAPRAGLRSSLAEARQEVAPGDRDEFDALTGRADENLVNAINDAFAPTFLICGALALLGAGRAAPLHPHAARAGGGGGVRGRSRAGPGAGGHRGRRPPRLCRDRRPVRAQAPAQHRRRRRRGPGRRARGPRQGRLPAGLVPGGAGAGAGRRGRGAALRARARSESPLAG